jgi:hypothetical protein
MRLCTLRQLTNFATRKLMAEQSASQLINDWVAAAKSANTNNAHPVATTIANFYANNAVLCTTPDAFTQNGIVNGQSDIEKTMKQILRPDGC